MKSPWLQRNECKNVDYHIEIRVLFVNFVVSFGGAYDK